MLLCLHVGLTSGEHDLQIVRVEVIDTFALVAVLLIVFFKGSSEERMEISLLRGNRLRRIVEDHYDFIQVST